MPTAIWKGLIAEEADLQDIVPNEEMRIRLAVPEGGQGTAVAKLTVHEADEVRFSGRDVSIMLANFVGDEVLSQAAFAYMGYHLIALVDRVERTMTIFLHQPRFY